MTILFSNFFIIKNGSSIHFKKKAFFILLIQLIIISIKMLFLFLFHLQKIYYSFLLMLFHYRFF